MCGILYSQDSNNFSDLSTLRKRGPEGFVEISNELGYFAHSMLHTIGEKVEQPLMDQQGVLLYNGSCYNSGSDNDAKWLSQQLDKNTDSNIDVIKNLNGEFAIVYVTDQHILFCVDPFDQRNLWFYHDQETKQLTVSSIPNLVKNKHHHCLRVEGNKIYIIDRNNFKIIVKNNKVFDLHQSINHFDHVFESFEQSVKRRYNPKSSINLLSSGFDSGVINCATHKIFDKVECVSDPSKEDRKCILDRLSIHGGNILPNYQGETKKRKEMFHDLIPINDIWDDPLVNPLVYIIENYIKPKNKKIVLTGNGGDEIYNDYQNQMGGFHWARTLGSFPSSLDLVWPWHNFSHSRLMLNNIRMDLICGYFGLEARNPLLDVDLVQSWLNTTHTSKNQTYKSWMRAYMQESNYPISDKFKYSWGQGVHQEDDWKLSAEKDQSNK